MPASGWRPTLEERGRRQRDQHEVAGVGGDAPDEHDDVRERRGLERLGPHLVVGRRVAVGQVTDAVGALGDRVGDPPCGRTMHGGRRLIPR